MAEKKAKTAEKGRDAAAFKHLCPSCGAESKVTMFAGYGRRGFFLVCEKNCGYIARTR
jgi:transcription elongation factor Elf1